MPDNNPDKNDDNNDDDKEMTFWRWQLATITAMLDELVYVPNSARAAATLGEQEKWQVYGLNDDATQNWPREQRGLVRAAPLMAQAISAWIERQGACFACLLDLRDEVVNDLLPKA